MGGDINYSDVINPEGFAGQVFLAVDRSGTATNGNIYMEATIQPTGSQPELTSCSLAARMAACRSAIRSA